MKTCLVLSALLLLATGLAANDPLPDLRVSTPGGIMTIRQVKLMRVEPDGLRVMHASGMAKVPYEMLPADLQAKYGFNDQAAQEQRAAAVAPPPAPVAAAPAPAGTAPAAATTVATTPRPAAPPQPTRRPGDDEPPAPLTSGPLTYLHIILPQYIGGPNGSSKSGCTNCPK
jgi:hypothetical protein